MAPRAYGAIAFAVAAVVTAALVFVPHSRQADSVAQEPPPPGTWPMYQLDATHNAVLARPGLRANWLTRLGAKINGGLAISGDTLYVDSFDDHLYALDLRSGALRWDAQAQNTLMSTPVIADGAVIVGSGNNGFLKPDDAKSQIWGRPQGDDEYAFDTSDGALRWRVHTVGQDMPSPAIFGTTAILANGDLHAYALDLATGTPRWQVDLFGVATMASMTIADGMAFTSTCRNAPYACETRAFDPRTGATIWTNPYGGSDCTPTVDDGLVFVNVNRDDAAHYHTGGTDVVVAIDEHTGKTRWTYDSATGPYTFIGSNERQIAATAHDGVLYQPIGTASLVIALRERDGRLLWSARTAGVVKMSPVVDGDRLYFGDTEGILYDLDGRTGRIMHTSSYLQPFATSPPVIVGETLFIANGPFVMALPLTDI